MAAAPRNIVNLKSVAKGYGSRSVLRDVTLGIAEGDRIGIVGRNGDGKSTLLRLVAGLEEPDAGALTRTGGVALELLGQGDDLDAARTIRDELVGRRADHEWAADPAFRAVLDGLLGGMRCRASPGDGHADRAAVGRRAAADRARAAAARPPRPAPARRADEPPRRRGRRLARAPPGRAARDRGRGDPRPLVPRRGLHGHLGGGRRRCASVRGRLRGLRPGARRARPPGRVRDARREQLLRKELAWLRRGPPARTAKPKFRIEAANALIADEPEVRDRVELLRFASARLGDKVLDAERVSVAFGDRVVLRDLTWRLGPGDRRALVGVNGAGKTTLIDLLAGDRAPSAGVVERGATVRVAHLSQDTAEIPGHLRVLESLEQVRGRTTLSDGQELTAGMLCDRFGFRGDRARTLVRDLSGGERRRLQLMRLLMDEPNVLLLDEPTNDLDIDTLTALEDLLDGWPGTLVVVSHDRYFVERVCDDVHALMGDGGIRHLPGGIDQYVELRRAAAEAEGAPAGPAPAPAAAGNGAGPPSGGALRAARKEVARLERALEKLEGRQAGLHEAMAASATDHGRLRELNAELAALTAERDALEASWLELSEALEA
jgi:ATP-binding cassette subfamily F protein uup